MDRQEKGCKRFMVQNLLLLGFGVFSIALAIGIWLTSNISKDIAKGFLFLGLFTVIPTISSLIPMIVAIKWVKDEDDIKFLLKHLKTKRKLVELVAFVMFLFLIFEFVHLAELLD